MSAEENKIYMILKRTDRCGCSYLEPSQVRRDSPLVAVDTASYDIHENTKFSLL